MNIPQSVVSKHARLYRFAWLTIVVLSSKHVLLSLTVAKLGPFYNTICHLWQPYWISGSQKGVRNHVNWFLSVDNMGIDTTMKTLPCLPRKLLTILWFDLINMLIMSIMQNATFVQICLYIVLMAYMALWPIYCISTIKPNSTQHFRVHYGDPSGDHMTGW